ncbi:MAG: hypothetical protein ACFBWO_01950 [Paracoccaceae bacterium]
MSGIGPLWRVAVSLASLALVAGRFVLGLTRPDHGHAPEGETMAHGEEGTVPTDVEAALAEPAMLLGHVLSRLYAAFGEREEGAVYDARAEVATGPALEALYLEKRAAMFDDPAGTIHGAPAGTTQSVHGIEVLDVEAAEQGGAVVLDGRWRVFGAVGHEDHVHVRGPAYAARLAVERTDGGWRLTGFTLTEVERPEGSADRGS